MPVWCCWDIPFMSQYICSQTLHNIFFYLLSSKRGRSIGCNLSNSCPCVLFSQGGGGGGQSVCTLPSVALSARLLSHQLTVANVIAAKLRGLGGSDRGSIRAFSISISAHSVDSTHSCVPLHQWNAKQQLTAVMRTTISSAHNQVFLPSAIHCGVHKLLLNTEDTKISPHTCHSLRCTLLTWW